MLFNSIDFAVFLPIVFILYWFVFNRNLKLQNLLIVIASFIFYGWWDWRFLLLMIGSASIDFFVGILLDKNENTSKRKLLLALSLIANLGILAFFKYFNFFIGNFSAAFSFLGYHIPQWSLKVVLPVGISFYTFQALSYTIDVYRKQLSPTYNIVDYFAFISFFPQLVAGPIERATHLLPQFYTERKFEYSKSVDGIRQILWGLFKKMVIADNCAIHANAIFDDYTGASGSTLIIGALFFTFQIYGDFSGYSDIAIGTARLFGFSLMKNFAFPYFSRDIAEFWRKWHISLSTWFRDYLYVPLGGSKGNLISRIKNTFIIFLVSGFWHGANWTFIVWGAVNALFFLPLLIAGNNRSNLGVVAYGKVFPSIREFSLILFTFFQTVIAWIFFRSASIEQALIIIKKIFSPSVITAPHLNNSRGAIMTFILLLFFITLEWLGRSNEYAIAKFAFKWPRLLRWLFYFIVIILILQFNGGEQEFIYFQF